MSSPEHHRPALTGWQAHLGRVPAAIQAAEPTWPQEDALLLHDLAGAIAYGIDAVRAVWEQAHSGTGITGYRIRLDSAPGDGPAVSTKDVTVVGGVVEATLLVNAEALAIAADADIRAAQAMMADAIRDIIVQAGLTDEAAASIRQAWVQSEPTFAVSISSSPTARPELASPLELDAAFTADAHKDVARRVRAAGVEAGHLLGRRRKRAGPRCAGSGCT
jgi:hypothetical protein